MKRKPAVGDLVVRVKNLHPEYKVKIGLISRVNGGYFDRGHVYYGTWSSMEKNEWRFATDIEIEGYKNGIRSVDLDAKQGVDNYSII